MVRETVLDNGLKVLIQEVHTAPLASVWCWYRVGRRTKGPGVTGVSHWCEHMNFKGTKNIPRDQVKGIIEKFGGSWNGYTWIDQTTYLETASKDALDRMLFIEAERMDALPLRSGGLRIRAHGDHLGAAGRRERSRAAARYRGHRHGVQGASVSPSDDRLAAGSADDDARRSLRALSALLRAVERHAGDRRRRRHRRGAEEGREAVRRHCAGAAPARVRQREPEQQAERRVVLRKPGTTAYWKAAFHAPAFEDEAFFPLLVADAVLNGAAGLNIWSGGGVSRPQRSARLYRALVDKGLASNVSGALMPTRASVSVRHLRQRRRRPDAVSGGRGRAARDRSPLRATASRPRN